MPFLSFSNLDIEFLELGKLIQRFYTTTKALLITNRVEPIHGKEFAKAVFDENLDIFVIYITALKATEIAEMIIYLSQIT